MVTPAIFRNPAVSVYCGANLPAWTSVRGIVPAWTSVHGIVMCYRVQKNLKRVQHSMCIGFFDLQQAVVMGARRKKTLFRVNGW